MGIDVYEEDVLPGKRGYIAVAAADRSVRVFSLSTGGQWETVFAQTFDEGFLPKVIRFRKNTRFLFIFSKTGGSVYVVFLSVGHSSFWQHQA